MRTASRITFSLALGLAASLLSQAAAAEKAPTAEGVIDLVGGRMARIFSSFGMPQDVFASDKENVCVDFDTFAFNVSKKTVQNCIFWSTWKEPVCDVKMNSTVDDVVKLLGEPRAKETRSDGTQRMVWGNVKDLADMDFMVTFTKDGKCGRILVSPK